MYNKILIANRGEIALRIIRTCKELGIKTVAVYSKADELSLHVRFADEAICIGPYDSRKSYLNIPAVISAAELTNSDAIHPGYGFLSENAEFSAICKEHNIAFIGPSPEIINSMGNKSEAKKTMESANIPVIPGINDILNTEEEALKYAEELGYPVLLKASSGGGGKGMRLVTKSSELHLAFQTAQSEAMTSFNSSDLYIEKFLTKPRHIEVQILADSFGNVAALGERECSIQRRHQKIIEESPSIAVTPEIRKKMCDAAISAAKTVNYIGAGTIEFLLDSSNNFYFMEMNTRIQVEHPVTEMVIGTDLIKHQILSHAGLPLPNWLLNPKLRGHAIECRINAENPWKDFMPSPGKITSLHMPGGNGVRVDSHVYSGYSIPPYYDSMIAKFIVHAPSRKEAIERMLMALEECVLEGIDTIIPYHKKILNDKNFISGNFDTAFLNNFNFKDEV